MKSVFVLSALLCTALSAPVDREFIQIPQIPQIQAIIPAVIIDESLAIGGPGGAGGDAVAIGADVTGGIGGAGVEGSGVVFNQGIIEGGPGIFEGNVANGAAGTVIGQGSITGSFENIAAAGDGGAGGSASS